MLDSQLAQPGQQAALGRVAREGEFLDDLLALGQEVLGGLELEAIVGHGLFLQAMEVADAFT